MNPVSLDVIGAFWRKTKRENCAGLSKLISRNYADVYILDILDSGKNWSNWHSYLNGSEIRGHNVDYSEVCGNFKWTQTQSSEGETDKFITACSTINKSMVYGRCVLKLFDVIGSAQHEVLVQDKLNISKYFVFIGVFSKWNSNSVKSLNHELGSI